MLDAYIYDGLRTPFGRHAGALAGVRPDDLLAGVIKAVIGRSAFRPEDVEDVIAGCTNQAGEDSRNVARHAGLLAGLPFQVPGKPRQLRTAFTCFTSFRKLSAIHLARSGSPGSSTALARSRRSSSGSVETIGAASSAATVARRDSARPRRSDRDRR